MNKNEITTAQVKDIQGLKNTHKTVGEWKKAMRLMAEKLGLTDEEILQINRGDL